MSIQSAAPALGAALLFGASTPLAKLLGVDVAPQLLAGLLCLGSGAGLAIVLLSLQPGTVTLSSGSMLIVAACLCWAVDNNLTRKVSTNDALLVACLKGPFAGATNTGLALALGVWLHIRERHEHDHTHQPLDHAPPHVDDAHHRHEHHFE
jgi:hypothetical protein